MSLLTEDQHNEIVMMIVDDYGSRLTGGEVFEITGLILENISGFETVDSNTLTQVRTYTNTGTMLESLYSLDSGTR